MPFPVTPIEALILRLNYLKTYFWNRVGEVGKAHLFKNNVNPDLNSSTESFVEADFEGYASIALAMTGPTMNDQGIINLKSALLNWETAAGDPEQTIYGIYITDDENNKLMCAQRFDTPQQMGGPFPQSISGVFRSSEPESSMGWVSAED